MDYYALMEHWASLVRDFKDKEREEHDIGAYSSEQLARRILEYVRYTRFRQYNLFTQQRGEEFENMLKKLDAMQFNPEAVVRFLETEELWKTTLEMGEQ